MSFYKTAFGADDFGFFGERQERERAYADFLNARVDLQWFAAEDEGRTEEPSDYKKRKAREEGRVAKSQELNGALCVFFSILALIILAPWMLSEFIELLKFFISNSADETLSGGAFFRIFLRYFFRLAFPIAIISMIAGVFGNVIQNGGFLFTLKPITPKFSRILPRVGQYFRRTLFSAEGLFNFFKSIVKIAAIGVVAWLTIKNQIPKLLSLMQTNLWMGISFIASLSARLLLISAMAFLVMSVPDYIFQRYMFRESLKMTKQEVKEEYKMMEGDPVVRGRLRRRMTEILNTNIAAVVPQADVVITNPTHYAIALEYDQTRMSAPVVTAKGADEIAQRIKEIARSHDVPLVENRPLARALYANVEIGDIIPVEYYKTLAIIFKHVYAVDKRKKNRRLV